MLHLVPIIALGLYIVAVSLFGTAYVSKHTRWKIIGSRFLMIGILFHTISIPILWTNSDFFSLGVGADYYYILAWLLLTTVLFLGKKIYQSDFGALAVSIAVVVLIASSYLAHFPQTNALGDDNYYLLGLHVVPALAAEVCLLLALIASLAFLVQERRLKHKEKEIISIGGPSLVSLDRVRRAACLVGFAAISFAVVTGLVWGLTGHAFEILGDYRQWIAGITWLFLGFILAAEQRLHWSSRRAASFLSSGAAVIVLAVLTYLLLGKGGLHGGA